MTEEKLLLLKQKIEKAKTKSSELKGRRKQLMSSLKKEWGCSTLQEAKEKLQILNEELASLGEKKEEVTAELEEFELL